MIGTPGPHGQFVRRVVPPLVAVDNLSVHPRCKLIASAVAEFSNN